MSDDFVYYIPKDVLALCQSVSRETHKIRKSCSSVRVGDAQFL